MAVISDSDFSQIKKLVKADPTARAVFDAWALSKPTYKALFQACEDWNTGGFGTRPATSYKAAVDAVTVTTNQQAKAVWGIWARWKSPQTI